MGDAKPSEVDISALEVRFNDLIVFFEEEIQRTERKCKAIVVGKFLGSRFFF